MATTYIRAVEEDEVKNRYKPMKLQDRDGREYLRELRKRAPNGTSLVVTGNSIVVTVPEFYKTPKYEICLHTQRDFYWVVLGVDQVIFYEISTPPSVVRSMLSKAGTNLEESRIKEESFFLLTEYVAKEFWNMFYKENKKLIKEDHIDRTLSSGE